MSIIIFPGEEARARVKWLNAGEITLSPKFRWDLRRSGIFVGWNEGSEFTSPPADPGKTAMADIYCRVPVDWDDTGIDAKLMLIGIEGPVWQEESVYAVPSAPEAEYELVYEKLYEPEASDYKGKADVCTMYFDAPPEQIPGLPTIITTITAAVSEKIMDNDGTMLRLRIFQGKGEWWNSKWKVEAAIHSSPFPWSIVVPLIVALLIVIGFAFILYEVVTTDWGKVISPFMWAGIAVAGGVAAVAIIAAATRRKKKT